MLSKVLETIPATGVNMLQAAARFAAEHFSNADHEVVSVTAIGWGVCTFELTNMRQYQMDFVAGDDTLGTVHRYEIRMIEPVMLRNIRARRALQTA